MNIGDVLKEMSPSEVDEYIDGFIKVARESIKDPGISKDEDIKGLSLDELSRRIDALVPIQNSRDIISDLEKLKISLKKMPAGTVCKKAVYEMVERIFNFRNKPDRFDSSKYKDLYTVEALIDKLIAEEKQKGNNNKAETLIKLKTVFPELPRAVFCEQIVITIYEMLSKDENNTLTPYYSDGTMGSR